eukprot:2545262-Alexandrium_andersonii.AAC.1
MSVSVSLSVSACRGAVLCGAVRRGVVRHGVVLCGALRPVPVPAREGEKRERDETRDGRYERTVAASG